MGPAGELLTNKHPRPAVGLLSAASSQANLCQNQGTRLWRCNLSECLSVSDARLGRSKASHINSSSACSLQCSFVDPTAPTLESTTIQATSEAAHVRCGRLPSLHLFQCLNTAENSTVAKVGPCVLVFVPQNETSKCSISLHIPVQVRALCLS